VSKLLFYLNNRSTSTSDGGEIAKAELLTDVNGITSYFQKLSGSEVSLILIMFCI